MRKKEKAEKSPLSDLEGLVLVLPPKTSGVDWEYRLTPEGLQVGISCQVGTKTATITNVLPWDAFIQGLALGWKTYHQENQEFTELINAFIERQIQAKNYVPHSEGSKIGEDLIESGVRGRKRRT